MLTRSLILICALVSANSPTASKPGIDELPQPYPKQSWFLSDPAPEEITPVGNPLDWVGARIGLDVRNFELPRAYENDYRFVCRFPIIDAVANRPLYMKQWTEDYSEALLRAQREHGLGSVGLGLEILTGDPELSPTYGRSDPNNAKQNLADSLAKSHFTIKYQAAVLDLYTAYHRAGVAIRYYNSHLSADDSAYFAQNPVAFLLPDGEKLTDLTGNTAHQYEYINRLRNAELYQIFCAGEGLADAVAKYIVATRSFGATDFWTDTTYSRTSFVIKKDYLKVTISGAGDDIHDSDARFLIDLGGDDSYTNNAGGAVGRAAICIDHSGNDVYDAKDRRYVQGCGVFGVGILADLQGDDRYTARHFAQGAGIAGVGVLYDGAGDDTYSGHGFTQGAAMFGLGMLMDDNGDDTYDCATLSQGGAACMGLGILSDLAGDDKYRLATDSTKNAFNSLPGYGQGGALSFRPSPWRGKFTPYGGVGMLIDGSGDDDYVTNGWCDQGGSYIMSLGSLYDGGGNDHYKANTGQGSGIHITNAILIDKSGDDFYEGGFRTGGSGGDRSPGFLIDYAGNDTYQSNSSSYGTGVKPFAVSLMIDYSGDDKYITSNPVGPILFNCWDSFGGVWPESAPNLYPWAICLDLGGKDDYQVRNRANNSIRHSFGHGLQVDMEWQGGDVIGRVDNPLESYPYVKRDFYPWNIDLWSEDNYMGERLPLSSSAARARTGYYLRALHNPNLFVRFEWIGIVSRDTTLLRDLLTEVTSNRPLSQDSVQFNRDFLEIVHTYLIEKRFPESLLPVFAKLLNAPDPEVRTIIADDIGAFGLKSCDDALVKALDDPEPQVRRFAYRSLMALKSNKGLKKAKVAVKKDASEDVRRLALVYLTSEADKSSLYPILSDRLGSDDASSVKVAAADGLGRLGNREALPAIRQAVQSYDVYVKRAAAKALCELGEVEGIGFLIESLSFPSIDAFYNYDYNVPNFIATYAGYDLPEPDRFEQNKWREWFAANREKIDLKENVAASKAFAELQDSLRGAPDEKLIELLEGFLKLHPGNRNAAGTLAAQLNRIAWDMATAPSGTPRFNPRQAIIYSERSVELVNDPNYWDTLAESYFAAGLMKESAKICNEQLLKSPGNRMFLDRLEKIEKIKK
jgi:hypothetical protein